MGRTLFKICRTLAFYAGLQKKDSHYWPHYTYHIYKVVTTIVHLVYIFCLPSLCIALCQNLGKDMDAGIVFTFYFNNFKYIGQLCVALALMKNITFVAVVVFKTAIVQSDAIVKLVKVASVEEEKIRNLTDQTIRKMYKSNVDYSNRVAKIIITNLYASGTMYALDGKYIVGDLQPL